MLYTVHGLLHARLWSCPVPIAVPSSLPNAWLWSCLVPILQYHQEITCTLRIVVTQPIVLYALSYATQFGFHLRWERVPQQDGEVEWCTEQKTQPHRSWSNHGDIIIELPLTLQTTVCPSLSATHMCTKLQCKLLKTILPMANYLQYTAHAQMIKD